MSTFFGLCRALEVSPDELTRDIRFAPLNDLAKYEKCRKVNEKSWRIIDKASQDLSFCFSSHARY